MKIAVIDTETTGLFDFKAPADAPGQPRMAQFGGLLLDTEWPDQIDTVASYIRPDGWTMSAEAGAVNGLTTDFLMEHGSPVEWVLLQYARWIDEGRVIVAYNAQFDLKVMRAEMRRANMDDRFEKTKNICVMRPMTGLCCIPSPRGGYKWPKLEEACAFFGIENAKAHDAMGDAEAALSIFWELSKRGLLPEPAVHFAKDRPAA